MMKKWEKLTRQERQAINLDFLQCEGYLDDGTECQTSIDYYYKSTRPVLHNAYAAEEACERGEMGGALPADI